MTRVHQYFGIKAAQQHVLDRKGGIIWHTQGSGKSIVMVVLAKWILENNPNARVVIVTDRDELDKQIEGVFGDAGEKIYRTNSGRDLWPNWAKPLPVCCVRWYISSASETWTTSISSSGNWNHNRARRSERFSFLWTNAIAHKAANCTG